MSASQLGSRYEFYGKPHVLAAYTGDGVGSYRHADAPCPICHCRMISNTHHIPDRRTFDLRTPLGVWPGLRPALIGLCGSGTTGCHGRVERGEVAIEWQWVDADAADDWRSGRMLAGLGRYAGIAPHSERLYRYGGWRVTDVRTGASRLLMGGGLDG